MSAPPQTNGVAGPSQASQSTQSQTQPNPADSQPTQSTQGPQPAQQEQRKAPPPSPSTTAPRPRDARVLELLLTSQGVTSYESRVPLLLMDFAYRHTAAVLNDAIHLSVDPHTTHAGARASSTAGANASLVAQDASVSGNAIRLAIASRQGYQFRGGNNAGGVSKEWMQELAKERNRIGLPRVPPNEWAVRLPAERFVLSGVGWGLRDDWGEADDEDEDEDAEMEDVGMEGIRAPDVEDMGDGVEGGTMEDVFGDEMDQGEDQATA